MGSSRSPRAALWRMLAAGVVVVAAGAATPASGSARTSAGSGAPECAATAGPPQSTVPAPGDPCWVDVDPYPFGTDGNPVDAAACSVQGGGQTSCLKVSSFAFRAWNRGLAATDSPTFAVWLFNGTRWFPDPTYPGRKVCNGDTVLWAGKLDYWLIGDSSNSWSRICRFDGADFLWEPLSMPKDTLARIASSGGGAPLKGAITSGTCFSWDNCWFFGSYGTIVHWDGTALTDSSSDFAKPWLQTEFAAATSLDDTAGKPLFGVAVGTTQSGPIGNPNGGSILPAEPDGSAPPEIYTSGGGLFSPEPTLSPPLPTTPLSGDPFRTDLVAASFDSSGFGWAAGDPPGVLTAGHALPNRLYIGGQPGVTTPEESPLVPLTISPPGIDATCRPPRFRWSAIGAMPPGENAFLWTSIGIVPGTTDVIAAGKIRPDAERSPIATTAANNSTATVALSSAQSGALWVGEYVDIGTTSAPQADASTRKIVALGAGSMQLDAPVTTAAGDVVTVAHVGNADGDQEPVLVRVSCNGSTTVTRFRVPDTERNAAPPLIPADKGGVIRALAVNASNDAWAASSIGALNLPPGENPANVNHQPPHIYRLTDGTPPDAPAGDDQEVRPLRLKQDPPIIVFAPLPPPPPPPPPTVTSTTQALPSAVDHIRSKLHTTTKRTPLILMRNGRRVKTFRIKQTFTLTLSFRVVRPTMLGLTALHGKRVVASTGLRTFKPKTGRLVLKLKRTAWPTRLAFITDLPKVVLADPGQTLTGTVQLSATATAIKGRTIASVRFEYAPTGTTTWTPIGTVTAAPFATPFDTTKLTTGPYDLRAVATDSASQVGISAVRARRQVQNGSSP